MTYTYGIVERANDGKLLYTMLGAADAGEFNDAKAGEHVGRFVVVGDPKKVDQALFKSL